MTRGSHGLLAMVRCAESTASHAAADGTSFQWPNTPGEQRYRTDTRRAGASDDTLAAMISKLPTTAKASNDSLYKT